MLIILESLVITISIYVICLLNKYTGVAADLDERRGLMLMIVPTRGPGSIAKMS
jgi:hypothetical protein